MFQEDEDEELIIKCGKLKIRPQNLIYIVLFLTLVMNALSDELGITTNIRYLNDLIIIVLFIVFFRKKNFFMQIADIQMNTIYVAMIIFSVVNIISAIINLVPVNLVIWAVRNTYRFFLFYWACIVFLRKKDIEKIFDFMYKLQWINVALILYQFLILDLKQDYIGGIFGHGGNAGLLIYSVLLLAYAVSRYIANEYSLFKMLFVLVSTCLTSVLAEIRIFFLMAIIIIIVNFWLNKNLMRKMGIIFTGIVLFFLAVDIYSNLFPYVSLSIEAFLKEGTSTGGGYNISRLNAFKEINNLFFKDDVIKNLFGYGFGNCEYSSIPIFCSEFYDLYGNYNYRWFTNQWIFLETGYVGIISYIFIFGANLVYSIKKLKVCRKENYSYHLVCIILSIICIISIFYNSLLKADFGYLAFFSLAISAILWKEERYAKTVN